MRNRPGNRLLAVAYIRVSTDEQKLGPAAQRAAIEAWAAREGVQVVTWHSDQGVSGAAPIEARPALCAALAALRARRAGVLVVAKRDRVARDVVIAAMAERAASSAGARLVSADGTANGDSPADAFMRTVIDGAAAYERGLIRARTKAALATKRARGEAAGNAPFGFSVAADGRLVPNARETATLAAVRELRASGMPVRSIAAELAVRGLVSARTGRPYGKSQVARMLVAGLVSETPA